MDIERLRKEMISTSEKRLQDYQTLIDLAEEQQSILVKGRHEDLPQNVSRFDPLLLSIEQLDDRDRSLIRRIETLRAAGREAECSDIMDMRKPMDSKRSDAALRLRELTEINAHLLSTAMHFVGFTMNVISRAVTDSVQGSSNVARGDSASMVIDTWV